MMVVTSYTLLAGGCLRGPDDETFQQLQGY